MPTHLNSLSRVDVDTLIYEDVTITQGSAPTFILDGKAIDPWEQPYAFYHSKSPVDYVRERILEREKKGVDSFPDIVGKEREKELVKDALFSGSPILFKGEKGYGKTTFSKAIAKLLPDRLLAIKGCKIYDDPTHPVCFSCKYKIRTQEEVELAWIPKIWVRIPGDPMLTTRQLVGGISIQKIREGYDPDHPAVFIPGRAVKANRGVGYFDELGALPTSLQTLLHELFEEHQVTTTEGDILPFKISTLEVASTNPANYRGTSPIKEPLLDRMEAVEIGPPETLEEEVEIGRRNMFVVSRLQRDLQMPLWHTRLLARVVRLARDKAECSVAKKLQQHPSCRGTIKLFDHVKSKALRSGREVPLLSDYGEHLEMVELAMVGRIEVEYGVKQSKQEVIRELLSEAVKRTCKEVYDEIPAERFEPFYRAVRDKALPADGESYMPITPETVERVRGSRVVDEVVRAVAGDERIGDELYLSALEIILHSIGACLPRHVERRGQGYILREMKDEAAVQ